MLVMYILIMDIIYCFNNYVINFKLKANYVVKKININRDRHILVEID